MQRLEFLRGLLGKIKKCLAVVRGGKGFLAIKKCFGVEFERGFEQPGFFVDFMPQKHINHSANNAAIVTANSRCGRWLAFFPVLVVVVAPEGRSYEKPVFLHSFDSRDGFSAHSLRGRVPAQIT